MDPMPKRGAALDRIFECSIGLVEADTRKYIPLKTAGDGNFSSVTPLRKGSKFKIEIRNGVECYIYLFTPNAAGSSFVLFPYKPSHSPYCGITGTRLFPRLESIRADDIGSRDYMGVVVSKEPIDYQALNGVINKTDAADFPGKLRKALSNQLLKNVNFSNTPEGSIYFKAGTGDRNQVVAAVVEINKQ